MNTNKKGYKMSYQELKASQQKELNEFKGLFFAFNNEQLAKGMNEQGLKDSELDKICSIGSGGYLLKDRKEALAGMFKRQKAEKKEFNKQKKQLLNSLIYELNNNEYCITYDVTETLEALDLKKEDLPVGLLKKACKKSLEMCC